MFRRCKTSLLRKDLGTGAMPTLAVGMWRSSRVSDMPTTSVGMAPSLSATATKMRGSTPTTLRRPGMTLLELLLAMTITAMVIGTLGVLANGVQLSFQYAEGHGLATQHARVVLDRITQSVREATANEQFPGAIVLADEEGSWRFPETLVVWHPAGVAADPEGLPRFNELIVYCPDPAAPNRLVEITAPGDARAVPPVDDEPGWITAIEAIKASSSSDVSTLTELVRTCLVTGDDEDSRRGAVRFETRLRPSAAEWADYDHAAGTLDWQDLSWPQGIYGSQTGLRQTWVRVELQLVTGAPGNSTGGTAIPFFGSAALYHEMHR